MGQPGARGAAALVAALVALGCLLLAVGPERRDAARRRLRVRSGRRKAGYDTTTSWFTGEDQRTSNGVVPSMTCPRGKYRPTAGSDSNYQRLVSLRTEGCRDCPAGRYGTAAGLKTEYCSADCPMGRYRDKPAGRSVDDCHLCPPGRYGQKQGLVTKFCTANCPAGKYSNVWGLDDPQNCKACPEGGRFWQCTWELKAQHFSGDRVHHYDLDTRPADKLRSEPVQFQKPEDEADKDPDRHLPLEIPFKLPLRNTIKDDD